MSWTIRDYHELSLDDQRDVERQFASAVMVATLQYSFGSRGMSVSFDAVRGSADFGAAESREHLAGQLREAVRSTLQTLVIDTGEFPVRSASMVPDPAVASLVLTVRVYGFEAGQYEASVFCPNAVDLTGRLHAGETVTQLAGEVQRAWEGMLTSPGWDSALTDRRS